MVIVFKYRFVILVVETIRWKYSVYIWRGAAIVAFGFPDTNSNIIRGGILFWDVDVIGVRKKYSVYILRKHPNGGVYLFKYRPENRSMSTLFWCFLFLFAFCSLQCASLFFSYCGKSVWICIGNFICISGITCELIIWCRCILSVYTAILVSGCPACGPDVVLEFSARVGAWWAQGAERIGVDE